MFVGVGRYLRAHDSQDGLWRRKDGRRASIKPQGWAGGTTIMCCELYTKQSRS